MSSTTATKKGRPRGQPKAERRLKRELADKYGSASFIEGALHVIGKVPDAAKSSPVIATVTGVIALGTLYRFRLIGLADYLAGLALVGLIEGGAVASAVGGAAGQIIAGVGQIIPSIPFTSKSVSITNQEDFAANSPNVSFGSDDRSVQPTETVSKKAGYVPE